MKNRTSTLFYKKRRIIANVIIEIIKELDAYLPLTVRQVFYQLVAGQVIPNTRGRYDAVSEILVTLRVNDIVPWAAIIDRTRRTTEKRGVSNVEEWLEKQAKELFDPKYYGRCYVQGQDVYVEVVTEKDALAAIFEEVCWTYCVRLNVGRGQISATMTEEIASRLEQALMQDKKPILIHFGDLDPSGVAIPKALKRNLLDRHGIDAKVIRAALNPDQVEQYSLPTSLDAAKKTDSNYKAWLAEYGPSQAAVELDALHPAILKEILTNALGEVLDVPDMVEQQKLEGRERELIKEIRRYTLGCIGRRYGELIPYAGDYVGGY